MTFKPGDIFWPEDGSLAQRQMFALTCEKTHLAKKIRPIVILTEVDNGLVLVTPVYTKDSDKINEEEGLIWVDFYDKTCNEQRRINTADIRSIDIDGIGKYVSTMPDKAFARYMKKLVYNRLGIEKYLETIDERIDRIVESKLSSLDKKIDMLIEANKDMYYATGAYKALERKQRNTEFIKNIRGKHDGYNITDSVMIDIDEPLILPPQYAEKSERYQARPKDLRTLGSKLAFYNESIALTVEGMAEKYGYTAKSMEMKLYKLRLELNGYVDQTKPLVRRKENTINV